MWMHSRNGPTPAAVVYSCSFLLPPGKQPFLSYAGLIWPQLRGDNKFCLSKLTRSLSNSKPAAISSLLPFAELEQQQDFERAERRSTCGGLGLSGPTPGGAHCQRGAACGVEGSACRLQPELVIQGAGPGLTRLPCGQPGQSSDSPKAIQAEDSPA